MICICILNAVLPFIDDLTAAQRKIGYLFTTLKVLYLYVSALNEFICLVAKSNSSISGGSSLSQSLTH